ncbi:cilia- and flagella-associated protein 57 isoform X2 [Brienomyrus brachyistius]|uniref:cilia- and flagella-associated protein 57 isoform X2 n=1 Tax=Brienomyrus brachyistius TaxID=42636 RepID=UPI0020B27037|nr:cilia- and flagella-associated protein 57 isoform X2 [Brienomyrus brachyistius]
MSSVVAQSHYIFGVRSDVANNLCFLDDQTVVYPAGNHCVCYNIDLKWQRFIPGKEKSSSMCAIAISANRRYLAVAERADGGTVTVYDLREDPSRKRKVLGGGDVLVRQFVCLAFSTDSKYVIGQSGDPDWTLFYWMWEKQRVMATVKTGGVTNPIYQVSFNPENHTEICVSGKGVFKLLHYFEGSLKQSSSPKLESHNFLAHGWMSKTRVIAATDTGSLMVFDSGDLRREFSVKAGFPKQDAESSVSRKQKNSTDCDACITSIVAYSRGFACSAGKGTVCLFEKTEEKDYIKTREILIPEDHSISEFSQAKQQEILTLCISPSEETLAASTDAGQLYSISLSSAEMCKEEQVHFQFLSHFFHSDAVTGLSICNRKPLVATCSVDCSVRIWNYESNTLELCKGFQEEPYSVALHPLGLFILTGFADKLCFMNLLTDDIRTFKEFSVRGCRECAFSHGGHMFAAVSGHIILIYSSVTFENTLSLQGHNGKVRSIIWSEDDSILVSCGTDGAVYEWSTLSGKRLSESVLKSCSYSCVTMCPDAKTIFAAGSDCSIKEIQDCQILREIPTEDVLYTTIAMSHSGRVLFAGTSAGTIRTIKYPLPVKNAWTEYLGHAAPITKMVITSNDQMLLTISEDGCLLIWKLIDKEGWGLKRDKEIHYAEETLITKLDLEEKNQAMLELKTRVHELQIENEYHLRLKDMNYKEKTKELAEKFVQQIELLETKNQVLRSEKDKQELAHKEAMAELTARHSRELQDAESTNNQKLVREYEKYQELLLKSQRMEEDYEQKLQSLEKSKAQELEEQTRCYEGQLQEGLLMLEQHRNDAGQKVLELEECNKQMEEDGEREIQDLRLKYERKLKDEKDTNLQLMGEIGVMRKKLISVQQEIDRRSQDINKMKQEEQKILGVIKSLEKEIQGLRKEIQERDETIQDKEKRIFDLKKKNQELEKFKFVLDYKIKDLKKQIEPRENEIKDMKEQIRQMEGELEQFQNQNTQLDLNIGDLKMKLKTSETETHRQIQKVRQLETLVDRFKTDLHNCVGHIQEPRKLKDSICKLYHRYVQQSDLVDIVAMDADIQKEYSRQREHMERTMASLQKKLAKESEVHHAENVKIMKENVSLIREINRLRCELRLVHAQLHEYKNQESLSKNLRRRSYSGIADGATGPGVGARPSLAAQQGAVIQLEHERGPQPQTRRTRPTNLPALST